MAKYRPLRRLLPIAATGGILLCVLAMAQQNGDAPKPAPPAAAAPTGPAAPKPAEPAAKQDEGPIIRVQAEEVILPVTVKDEKGRFISNLVASDFRVLDEGRPQRISFFSHTEKQPIVVGFLVDQSSNVRIHWDKFREAVRELVWNLLPGDPTLHRLPDPIRQQGGAAGEHHDGLRQDRRAGGQDEAGRGRRALRRHLPGVYGPRAGSGRAVRTAPRHHRGGRRARHGQFQDRRPRCWSWPSATRSRSSPSAP